MYILYLCSRSKQTKFLQTSFWIREEIRVKKSKTITFSPTYMKILLRLVLLHSVIAKTDDIWNLALKQASLQPPQATRHSPSAHHFQQLFRAKHFPVYPPDKLQLLVLSHLCTKKMMCCQPRTPLLFLNPFFHKEWNETERELIHCTSFFSFKMSGWLQWVQLLGGQRSEQHIQLACVPCLMPRLREQSFSSTADPRRANPTYTSPNLCSL